jgi:BlaI family penicillinase repressor
MEQRPVFHSRTPGSISGGRKARLYNRANRRLEFKRAVRRASKVNNAHVFEAVVSRSSALHRMIDELVSLFGGRRLPSVAHLIESGKLTREEVREAQKALRNLAKKDKDQ